MSNTKIAQISERQYKQTGN